MNTKLEKIGENKAKIIIEVPFDKFKESEDKAFNKQKPKLNVPGFRKGKVTKEMAYKVYGREAFLEDAINECINATYYDAIKDCTERILSKPKIDVTELDIKEEKPFVYTAEVAIVPTIKLPKYKGVTIEKTDATVTDDEINEKLKEEQEKNARLVSVERKTKKGDIISLNFEGFVDGVAFKGGKAEKYQLELGSKSFIDNFEDQLIDKAVDEDIDVNVTFPEDYNEKNLAGKPALFKCKIVEIKEKQLPEIDDEFVSEISEFEKLDDYKNDIKKKLAEFKEKKAKEADKLKILEAIAKDTNVDIAEEAIESQIDEIINDYSYRLRYQGLEFDRYLEMTGKTMEDFRKEQVPIATNNIKNSIILEQIAKDEKIEASDEMVAEEIERTAKGYGMDVAEFKKSYENDEDMKRLKDDLLYPAVLEFLYQNAKLK